MPLGRTGPLWGTTCATHTCIICAVMEKSTLTFIKESSPIYMYIRAYILSDPDVVGDHGDGVSLGRIQTKDFLQQSYIHTINKLQ